MASADSTPKFQYNAKQYYVISRYKEHKHVFLQGDLLMSHTY